MRRLGLAASSALAIVLGLGSAASAATLLVSTDKLTYAIGESVTVSVVGDSQGASDNAIDGVLNYSSALTDTLLPANQSLLISGITPWLPGILSFSDGSAEMFDQSRIGAATVSNLLNSSVLLTATGLGTVNLGWAVGLDFFGLTSAPGTSFTVTPEPGTALLLVSGLAALASVRRSA